MNTHLFLPIFFTCCTFVLIIVNFFALMNLISFFITLPLLFISIYLTFYTLFYRKMYRGYGRNMKRHQ